MFPKACEVLFVHDVMACFAFCNQVFIVLARYGHLWVLLK